MKMRFNSTKQENGVYYLTPEDTIFSDCYLEVRKKEKRILSDNEVKSLPYLKKHEWPYRIKSTVRFIDYIDAKHQDLNILTIGCGNGWFANKIAQISPENQVLGVDINREELEQASRLFRQTNLHFAYADIYNVKKQFKQQFNIITLNGAIQYFEDLKGLIELLKTFLLPKGEIHIIDSPFYKTSEINNAKKRSKQYYTKLGVPKMAQNYFAHDQKLVKQFEILYSYNHNILNKLTGKKDSPFSWYRYIK